MILYLKNLTVTDITALGGLVIASISLGWNILNEIRKIPKAKVSAMVALMVQQGNLHSGKDTYFSVTITNTGSRPIRINGIAYDGYKWWWHPFKKKRFIIIPRGLPKTLNDGEEHTEMFVYKPEEFEELLKNNINRLYAWDSSGRQHSMSMLAMIKLKNDICKHLTKEKAKALARER